MQNGDTLPTYNGKVNKAELIRRVINRNPVGTTADVIVRKVKLEYGQTTNAPQVHQILSQLKKRGLPAGNEAHLISRGNVGETPVPTPEANGASSPETIPQGPPAVAAIVRSARRLLVLMAGDKDAAKELIDLL